ncbi:importin-4 [Oncorhynchus kisutch]|uniref:importin-4 n=1 Tax=Oncorhynchus kisutch TaxID=8019 RepID=UPI0012DEE3FB|nr:importin-4-like [Oncorhynchus kisutch]
MSGELEQILLQLTQPDNAIIQQATAQLKLAFKDPAIIPALCAVMTGSQNTQIRQSAAVMLRMRVKKHWKKISPDHRESLKAVVLKAFQQETEHTVRHSLSQLSAVMVKHETPDRWPALFTLLNQSTKSNNPMDRQVGLLLLSKVVESNPEPFKPHYRQLLQLFGTVLRDLDNPTAMYYSILTLTAMTAYTGTEEMNLMRSLIPTLIIALRHLIKADQDQASEAMEVFDELMESEVSIMVPHITEIVHFCLEVSADTTLTDSLRVKALSCIAFLIRLKSKTVLKQKLLNPILQTVFPVLSAAPPPGEEDPEDEENSNEDDTDNESPKHFAAQVIDTMALHMPPEKLFHQLMPLTQACLASDNPYERKAGLMCLAVLAEGCADHIRTKMLSSMLQTVCQSLSDSNQVVRSAGLFALGQFSEHLQPEVSKYCAELMPLLLGYMSALNQAKIGHVTKAFYALENFLENLGSEIEPYLPTLMETMLSALSNAENLKLKELAVSAIGAIANAAKEKLVPYFLPVIESLKGFLTDTRDEMRSLQTQALDTLSVLARTIGKEVFSPLAAECVQLGLNLTNTIDDPDLRRCTYSLFSAVSTVSPDCLNPHLTAITTIMLLSLKSTEGVTAHLEEDKTFVLLDGDDDDDEAQGDTILDEEGTDNVDPDIAGFSVENAYIDEKEDTCDALGEIAFNTGLLASAIPAETFQPYLNELLPLIMNKAKLSYTVADRSFSVGTLGEILQSLVNVSGGRACAGKLSNQLLPVLVAGVRDSDSEVRNNSVFALGALAQAAGPLVARDYPMMLSLFSNLLSKEQDRRVIDNLCAALCRMIMSNMEGVPLEQVVPALLAHLPLKEDMEENKTVYSCLAMLYSQNPALVLSQIKPIVSASSHVLGTNDLDTETQNTLVMLLRDVAQRHSKEFEVAMKSLPAEQKMKLTGAVSQS